MSGISKAFLIPGLAQLAFEESGQGRWEILRQALRQAGQQAKATRPDVLVLYSAQWISVLGHSFQYAANPSGIHVDENWHELGELSFSFQSDRELTATAERLARFKGLATKLVDFEGFPIDTATLVALKYFNPDNSIPVVIVSANIYASPEESMQLGQAVGEAIRQSGKNAVLINCSSLSHRFLPEEVTPETDRFYNPEDDQLNQKMLAFLQKGQTLKALEFAPEYAKQANAEMGFKGFYWLMGALNTPSIPADILAYEPLHGTGAAVLVYDNSAKGTTLS
jgi:2-aminophenol/2-amino-5-chlorophenol 1,6-dioxygenase alpha subunit